MFNFEKPVNECKIEMKSLASLPTGYYEALFYNSCFELKDVRKFHTDISVRNPREFAHWKVYHVVDGKLDL